MYHFKIELAAKFQSLHLPARKLRLTLKPPQISMVRAYYKVRTQQVMTPMFQGTQNCHKLPVCYIIILFSHGQLVGQVLHWQPSLRVIILLYQCGTDSVVTGVHLDFVQLVFVKNLQDWSTGECFF